MVGARLWIVRSVAVLTGLVSLFCVFYTARLLVVTHGLTTIRAGGKGTYIGAVAFPLLAVAFGWGTRKLLQSTRRSEQEDSGHS